MPGQVGRYFGEDETDDRGAHDAYGQVAAEAHALLKEGQRLKDLEQQLRIPWLRALCNNQSVTIMYWFVAQWASGGNEMMDGGWRKAARHVPVCLYVLQP